jgi:hypothetical protein
MLAGVVALYMTVVGLLERAERVVGATVVKLWLERLESPIPEAAVAAADLQAQAIPQAAPAAAALSS